MNGGVCVLDSSGQQEIKTILQLCDVSVRGEVRVLTRLPEIIQQTGQGHPQNCGNDFCMNRS